MSELAEAYKHYSTIRSSFSAPLSDEDRQRLEEERRSREEAEARKVEEAKKLLETLPARPGNNPHASQIDPWGNYFIGRVIDNEEAKYGGLIIPNVKVAQDRPHACEVIVVSDELDREKYPKLAAASDRLAEHGKSALFVYYPCGVGDEWTDDYTGERHVMLDPRFIRGSYNIERVRNGK